jgi:hypothetical protein
MTMTELVKMAENELGRTAMVKDYIGYTLDALMAGDRNYGNGQFVF